MVNWCRCRECGKRYDPQKSRADWRGYCSQKCVKKMVKDLAAGMGLSARVALNQQHQVLSSNFALGDAPWDQVEEDEVKERTQRARARVWRAQLRNRVLELLKEYCDEAENQDGYGYWSEHFEEVGEAVTDFGIYLKELEGDRV